MNKMIEKEKQLKNMTSLNLNAGLDVTAKFMASEKVSPVYHLITCDGNVLHNRFLNALRTLRHIWLSYTGK